MSIVEARDPGATARRICDVIGLVRKQPRTEAELVQVSGLSRATMRKYLDALHQEGHVYVQARRYSRRGCAAIVWAWNPEPFKFGDTPSYMVEGRPPRRRQAKPAPEVAAA